LGLSLAIVGVLLLVTIAIIIPLIFILKNNSGNRFLSMIYNNEKHEYLNNIC
jgi:hypothetical protein